MTGLRKVVMRKKRELIVCYICWIPRSSHGMTGDSGKVVKKQRDVDVEGLVCRKKSGLLRRHASRNDGDLDCFVATLLATTAKCQQALYPAIQS